MIAAGVFDLPSWLLAWFYGLTHSYAASIALIAVVVMVITAPLTLKSTKGMLEMQKLAPEMRRLQAQYRNDRTKLNEEMMKLYQEHKVNPLSSCLPLLAQMPVFIIMFRILYGLTYKPSGGKGALVQALHTAVGRGGEVGFLPRYISHDSQLFKDLVGQQEMVSLGLDLGRSPIAAVGDSFGQGLIYLGLVAVLGGVYFVQQRMVAARAAVSPTMSPAQQKMMQYLPVAFAVIQVFFVLGLVIYYIAQAVLRIGLQHYITRAFYGHEEALGRQAQRAGEHARELAKQDADNGGGGGGLFAQARRELASAKPDKSDKSDKSDMAAKAPASTPAPSAPRPTKRTTEPKNRPTPSGRGPTGRPQRGGRPGGPRSKSKRR